MGGPRARKTTTQTPTKLSKATQILPQYVQEVEKPVVKNEKMTLETMGKQQQEQKKVRVINGANKNSGYKKMKELQLKKFNIYGKDAEDFETESEVSMEKHSPVWSTVRKGTQLLDS